MCPYFGLRHRCPHCCSKSHGALVQGYYSQCHLSRPCTAILWAGNTPVFVDVEPDTLTIDPDKVEAAVTERTTAIMLYTTLNLEQLSAVCRRKQSSYIFSASAILSVLKTTEGRCSAWRRFRTRYHTKVFNTFEGGMVVSQNADDIKTTIMQNFGFVDETTVSESGINGKMSEFNAAVGLTQRNYVPQIFEARKSVDSLYRDLLEPVPGITTDHRRENTAIFLQFCRSGGVSRDDL